MCLLTNLKQIYWCALKAQPMRKMACEIAVFEFVAELEL